MPCGQQILRQPVWDFHARSGKTRDQRADLIGTGLAPIEGGQELPRPHQHGGFGEERIQQGRRNVGRSHVLHELT
jgi:hypothetical protein